MIIFLPIGVGLAVWGLLSRGTPQTSAFALGLGLGLIAIGCGL